MSMNFIQSEIKRRGIGYGCGKDFLSIGNIPPIESQCWQCGAKASERCRVVYRFKPPKTIYKFHVGRGTMWRGDYSDIETKRIRRSV
jgi:predicted amidophosphoribosyltransferase